MPQTITILTSGTRGDVQPYVALGRGLQEAGYRVRIATHAPFAPLIEAYGLAYAPVAGNLSTVLAQHPDALTLGRQPLRNLVATLHYVREVRPAFANMLQSAWHACQQSDTLLVTLPTTWGQSIAERLDIPCAWALLQPLSRTAAFPTVFLPRRELLGGISNRLSHQALEQVVWQPWRSLVNRWRRDTLGLAPWSHAGPFHQAYAQKIPWVYGISPRVVPRPADWPPEHQLTGFWFLDRLDMWQPPAALQRFIEAGPAPVAIGFGSMGAGRMRRLVPHLLAALRHHDQRAVLVGDQREWTGLSLPPQVFAIDAVPHDWLFERCAAIIHHGGAGTTAASLRAGVPTIVVPFAVDQWFWAQRVAALGCGPPPVAARTLNHEPLSIALEQALCDERMRSRARTLGQQLHADDGVGPAVALVQALVANY